MAPAQSRHLLSYANLVHAISGAAGSVTAMTTFYPLDTVRSVLQVDDKRESKNTLAMISEIGQEEGISSLYRGLVPVLVSVCASNFIYFYTFHGLKAMRSTSDKHQSALQDLILASLSGAVNVLATTPLWVVNTRLKLQGARLHSEASERNIPHYKGMIDAFVKICHSEGVGALWSSTIPSLLLVVNPGIQFMVYETVKRRLKHSSRNKELNGWIYFCIGALAKMVATFLTYPLQVVQSRLRYGYCLDKNDPQKQTGVIEMIVHLLKTQGGAGLYKGLEAKILQTVFTAALMFLCYEKIASFVFSLLRATKK